MAYDDDPLRLDNAPVASKQPKTVLRRQQQRAFSAKVGSTLARWQTAVTNELRREETTTNTLMARAFVGLLASHSSGTFTSKQWFSGAYFWTNRNIFCALV